MIEKKAQSSFEMVFLIAVVILISTATLGSFTSLINETIALAVAKQSITEKLPKQPIPYTIDTLEPKKCSSDFLQLKATTIPTVHPITGAPFNTLVFDGTGSPSNIAIVQTEVVNITNFQTVELRINEDNFPCP